MMEVRGGYGPVREDPAQCLEAPVKQEPLFGERPAGRSEEEHAEEKLEHAA
jgi:hypothetical protein